MSICVNNRRYKMTDKLKDSDVKFFCEMGEFIGNHLPQIVESFGKERVEQLINIWNETKSK